MKKILFAITILCMLIVSCDVATNIKDYDKSKLNITLYADDTEVEGGFTFTATEAWSTYIEYKSDDEGWITIDPTGGNAGEVAINIALDENLSGVTRTAIVHLLCGESNLNITVTQKSTNNPGDDDNGGDEPALKQTNYGINKIIQTIDDCGQTVVYTYTFEREDNRHLSPITKVRIGGLPREDGAATVYDNSIEYRLTYDRFAINIDVYANDQHYQTTNAQTDGRYIDQLSYSETIEMMPSMGSDMDVMQGVVTHTYYFNRHDHNDQLYRTDYVRETAFDGHEEYNQREVVAYNFEWERADRDNMSGIDYFNHAFNNTQLSWSYEDRGENIEYMSYNPELSVSNILGKSNPIEDRGCYIDINYLITTFCFEGAYKAYGGDFIYGILGLVGPPSFNLISDLSYIYEEWQGSTSHVEYTLNDEGLVQSFTMGNDNSSAHVQIEYKEF